MKIVKIKPEIRPHIGVRREIRLKETPLEKSEAIQISELRLDRVEDYHTNHSGYVLCFVVSGWMEAHCAGRNYTLSEGEGIIFEPGERHRINKGKGWMISISSVEYDNLETNWENN